MQDNQQSQGYYVFVAKLLPSVWFYLSLTSVDRGYSLYILILFLFKTWVGICLHAVHHIHAVPMWTTRRGQIPGTGVTDGCEPQCECWEVTAGASGILKH